MPVHTPVAGAVRVPAQHRKRDALPLYSGLVGASAAVAMGALALTSTPLPGIGPLANTDNTGIQAADIPLSPEIPITHSATPASNPTTPNTTQTTDDAPDTTTSDGSSSSNRPSKSPTPESASGTGAGKGKGPMLMASARTASNTTAQTAVTNTPQNTTRLPNTGGHIPSTPTPPSPPNHTPKPPTPDPPTRYAPPTVPSSPRPVSAEEELFSEINNERVAAGLAPLAPDRSLADLAKQNSKFMAANGRLVNVAVCDTIPTWKGADKAGCSNLAGQIIARGHSSLQALLEFWLTDPDHRSVLLNGDFKTLGIGVEFGDGGPWWTIHFGS